MEGQGEKEAMRGLVRQKRGKWLERAGVRSDQGTRGDIRWKARALYQSWCTPQKRGHSVESPMNVVKLSWRVGSRMHGDDWQKRDVAPTLPYCSPMNKMKTFTSSWEHQFITPSEDV